MPCSSHVKATDDDSGVFLLQEDKTTFWSIYCDSDFDRYSKEFSYDVLIWYLEMYHYVQSLTVKGSSSVSGKLPTYPSPKPTFCPKWELSVNVGLGKRGAVGSWDSVWRQYHVFLFWKVSPPPPPPPPHELFSSRRFWMFSDVVSDCFSDKLIYC